MNAAAKAAVDDEFAYLLMMDDDSEATDNMVEAMLTYLRQQAEHDMIGIIAAQSDPNLFGNTARKVWFTITSGSMLNMETYKQCGPFQNELFIDAVDHEYCFRIIQAGYQVINLDYLHLSHKIGELKQLRFFNITFYKWASHNPTRIYYMLRNFLHVLRKYRKILPMRTKFLIVYALTTSCFVNALFEKDTLLRLRYLSKAISDFNNNKMGKLSQAID